MNHTLSRPRNARRPPLGHIVQVFVLTLTALLSACMSAPPGQPVSVPATPLAKSVAAPPNQSGASALSYGAVTTAVTKGKTTQLELIQMFGGPNISTLDGDGLETWVYERSVSQTDVASKSQNWQAAANLGVAFGHVQAGVSAGGGQSQGASSTASSFR